MNRDGQDERVRRGGQESPEDGIRAASPREAGADADADTQARLSALRRDINAVDEELLTLLNRRAELSVRVGECKRSGGRSLAVFQPRREREILDGLHRRNEAMGGMLPRQAVEHVWREIFSSSRALQQSVRVAFLGPEGTFSHLAALECLGTAPTCGPWTTFTPCSARWPTPAANWG